MTGCLTGDQALQETQQRFPSRPQPERSRFISARALQMDREFARRISCKGPVADRLAARRTTFECAGGLRFELPGWEYPLVSISKESAPFEAIQGRQSRRHN